MQLRGRGIGLVVLALWFTLLWPARNACADASQSLIITANAASTWSDARGNIVQLDGPVTITLDRAKLTANNAVIWLEESQGGQPGEEFATIALLGNARIEQPSLSRSGGRLIATARINGPIRITAESRLARDMSASQTYQDAARTRKDVENQITAPRPPAPAAGIAPQAAPASTRPARKTSPVRFKFDNIENTMSDNKVAFVLSGNVAISRQDEQGNFLEMQAQRAVLFSKLDRLRDAANLEKIQTTADIMDAAYLEGDVRVSMTSSDPAKGEQRLEAHRVYYEFPTDRAVLTDAVLRAVDPQRQIPLTVRAKTVKQLSEGEFRASNAELSTSSFAVPSYSIRTDKAYVRQEDTGDPRYGARTVFNASHVTMNFFRVPVFYLPSVAGSLTERGSALRNIQFGNSRNFGWYIQSEWGLLETLGKIPPPDLDISFRADYFGDRGPAGGIDATYGGGFVSETSAQPWNFEGEFKSYFVQDTGVDILAKKRGHIDPANDFRGRVSWEHQHFFDQDWQLQLRSSWISDATFLEEWFQDDFNNDLPQETSIYLKRQKDTEAMTFLSTVQPNNIVTSADLVQEQFEVEKLPEFGYHRIGDAVAGNKATFFSNNTFGRVRFNKSGVDLGDQGYRFSQDVEPGRPSLGLVGVSGLDGPPDVTEDFTDRADLRQEVDFPFALGQIKVVPYAVGRYTFYSDSPDKSMENRLFAGTGVRFNTQFWKIDNNARSELFDVHRVRHIIEPEVHLWTSAQNVDPNELFIYDEPIDAINDISAVQFALRQRWQTKRGSPNRQRSVDFLTLNVEANFFANQPDDEDLAPLGFRGLFFSSLPESSIPRDSINTDMTWRISDTTIMLGDAQYNINEQNLATAAVGFVAQRGQRMTYFVGMRYIEELDSSIATLAFSYDLSRKYTIGTRQSFDFGDETNVYSSFSLLRKFDKFFVMLNYYRDNNDGESGFGFALFPEGLGAGASTDQLSRAFGGYR